MTLDAILVVKFLFSSAWSFFTCFTIPGTNVTPAEWGFFAMLVMFVARLVRSYFTNYGGGDGD